MSDTNPVLIGIAGLARSGKDTIAGYLRDDYRFSSLSFAAPIKRALSAMLGLSPRQLEGDEKDVVLPWLGVSPRELMQELGTGWGREIIRPDIWLIVCGRYLDGFMTEQWVDPEKEKKAKVVAINLGIEVDGVGSPRNADSCAGVVISDVRMANEAAFIRERGGLVLHVKRDAAAAVRSHSSEAGVAVHPGDVVIPNNGTLDELYARVDDVVLAMVAET